MPPKPEGGGVTSNWKLRPLGLAPEDWKPKASPSMGWLQALGEVGGDPHNAPVAAVEESARLAPRRVPGPDAVPVRLPAVCSVSLFWGLVACPATVRTS